MTTSKFSASDELFMRRAIQIAQLSQAHNQPNPEVGAVLVYQNRIIGEGYHQRYGQPHAEVNAVKNVQESDRALISQSCIYVSLEPCFHFGKTPPCVDLILRERIPRVVIGCRDPFELVAGQSISKLRAAGVEVLVGCLGSEIGWLSRRFFSNVQTQRPYIVLKWAQSRDQLIGKIGENIRISNPLSQRLLHRWRSEEQAILVGSRTAAADNPRLDSRLYSGKNPLRLVIDQQLNLDKNLHLFDNQQETWVFCSEEKAQTRQNLQNLRWVGLGFGADFLPNMLGYLFENRIKSLLVEGGAQLLGQFVSANLWDEARVFESPLLLHEGIKAPTIPAAKLQETQPLGNNQILFYLNR